MVTITEENFEIRNNGLFAINLYFILVLILAYVIFSIAFPNKYFYGIVIANLFIWITFVTVLSIHYVFVQYWKLNDTEHRCDSLFKPLSNKDLLVEYHTPIDSGILPDVGDMNFSREFIEENFCS